MVCACEVNTWCVCAFYACTCTDKVISLGMSEFLHTSMQTCCMCVDQDTRHLDFSSFFAHEAERKMKEKKSFECLETSVMEHSYLGIIAFKC